MVPPMEITALSCHLLYFQRHSFYLRNDVTRHALFGQMFLLLVFFIAINRPFRLECHSLYTNIHLHLSEIPHLMLNVKNELCTYITK